MAPSLIPGSGHSVDLVLAMCSRPLGIRMHSMPKLIISYHVEDNAIMCFPLTFQVWYLDFYI